MTTATATTESRPLASEDSGAGNWKRIAIPYAIAIAAQLPMLLLYFRSLIQDKPHYQTFPFAFIATAVIVWFRWPREAKMPFHRSTFSDLLLILGLMFGLICVLFKFPSAAAASVMLLITSLLARTVDRESLKSLWPAALPMFVYLTPPAGLDIWLITTLQRISAVCTSRLLDLAGLPHHMDGTVINVPGHEPYGIEQACSGVQSFFTLMLVAVVFVVWYRRPPLRSFLLLASGVFWTVFMNTIRIFLIPFCDQFDLDLAHGMPHAILGWATLFIGVLLLLSTDQFLQFLMGPVEPEMGRLGPFGKQMTWFWNKAISGRKSEEDELNPGRRKRTKRTRKPVSNRGRLLIWTACGLLIAAGLWSSIDVGNELRLAKQKVRFFDVNVTKPFEEKDLPEQIENWEMVNYQIDTRERGSDLGKRSDIWVYEAPRCMANFSLDQPFPGWHELTTCYQNQGWKLVNRKRKESTISMTGSDNPDDEIDWPYVVAEFEKETGERGYLVFSLFNSQGAPVNPPAQWNRLTYLISGMRNRLSGRIRGSLFDNSTYQVQTFVATFGNGLDAETQQQIEDRFLQLRNIAREKFINKPGDALAASN